MLARQMPHAGRAQQVNVGTTSAIMAQSAALHNSMMQHATQLRLIALGEGAKHFAARAN